MLLSMRDADECGQPRGASCSFRGQLAYRRGPMKLIYGHTALRGAGGDVCEWSEGEVIDCWNGWSRPLDLGPSRPPPALAPPPPGVPANSSTLSWGGVFLFDIEHDPLEEHDLSAREPGLVAELLEALQRFNASQISQDDLQAGANNSEPCGSDCEAGGPLRCQVPWIPSTPGNRCVALPGPPPAPTPPPAPAPAPPGALKSHLTESSHWTVGPKSLQLHGWACYVPEQPPTVTLEADKADSVSTLADGKSQGVCSTGALMGIFEATIKAAPGQDFTHGKHTVNGHVSRGLGSAPLGGTPQCIENGASSEC